MSNCGIVVLRDSEMPVADIMAIDDFIVMSWSLAKMLAESF